MSHTIMMHKVELLWIASYNKHHSINVVPTFQVFEKNSFRAFVNCWITKMWLNFIVKCQLLLNIETLFNLQVTTTLWDNFDISGNPTLILRNCVRQNHIALQLKLKKQLVYNYSATILWVLQPLCNYPLEIRGINK